MSRTEVLTDEMWAQIEPLLPPVKGPMGRPGSCNGGTWDKVLAALQVAADARGEIDWKVSVDSTIARVHQQGATAARCQPAPTYYTGEAGRTTSLGLVAGTNRTITASTGPVGG